jgi:hypothetical protein
MGGASAIQGHLSGKNRRIAAYDGETVQGAASNWLGRTPIRALCSGAGAGHQRTHTIARHAKPLVGLSDLRLLRSFASQGQSCHVD